MCKYVHMLLLCSKIVGGKRQVICDKYHMLDLVTNKLLVNEVLKVHVSAHRGSANAEVSRSISAVFRCTMS